MSALSAPSYLPSEESAAVRSLSRQCSLCGEGARYIFSLTVLGKYDVAYYRCPQCDLIQTEDPYWLAEAPWDSIAFLDTGAVWRANSYARLTAALCFLLELDPDAKCLDYGGGNGLFVRLMRDRGYNFQWWDRYAANVHAEGFDGNPQDKYALLTCFEVFEHLPNVSEMLERLFAPGHDLVFVSTSLHVGQGPDWWYYCPDVGGHVSFYSARTMAHVARRFDYDVICGRDHTLFLKNRILSESRRHLIEYLLSHVDFTRWLLRLQPPVPSRTSTDFTELMPRLVTQFSGIVPPSTAGTIPSNAWQLDWPHRAALRLVELVTTGFSRARAS